MTVAIFFLVYFMMGMDGGKATMGVGLGLFGIFSIMRYRTDAMPVREMTYLFLIVCLAVVHAMAEDFGELVIVDILTVGSIILRILVQIDIIYMIYTSYSSNLTFKHCFERCQHCSPNS